MNLETLFHPSNDEFNCLTHCDHPVSESVSVGAGRGNLVDAYINEGVGIGLHSRSSFGVTDDLECGQFLFTFDKEPSSPSAKVLQCHSWWKPKKWFGIRGPRTNDMKFPVSVLPRPIVQYCKGAIEVEREVVGVEFGSVVRLYRFDKSLSLVREWRDFPSTLLEVSPSGADGEFKIVMVGRGIDATIDDCRSIDTGIQSGAQLVKELAQVELNRIHNLRAIDCSNSNEPCPIILHIEDGFVEVFLGGIVPSLPNEFSVGIRPFNALPTILESPWHQN